jgi:hypothetical protein
MKRRFATLRDWLGPDANSLRWKVAWCVVWIALSLLSSIVSYKLDWVRHETGSIYDISSGFSPYVRSLSENHRFVDTLSLGGAPRTTMRLPAVPFFHFVLSLLVGQRLLFHLLAKNLVVFGICACAIRRLAVERRWGPVAPFAILGLMALNPVAFRILPTLGGEEAYYAPLLVLLFVALCAGSWTQARMHQVGVVLALLCLTKSTLTILVMVVLGFVIARARTWRSLVPAAYVAAALGGWSVWSHATTHRWTHVVNISAYDGINFFKGNNEFVQDLYPDVHLDALDAAGLTAPPEDIRGNEWAVSDYFRHRAFAYLSADGWRTMRFLAYKAAAPFVMANSPARIYVNEPIERSELTRLAQRAKASTFKSRVVAGGLWIYKMLWLVTIAWAARSVWSRKNARASLLYLLLSGAIAVPFVVGFAYINHLFVLYTLMVVYAGSALPAPDRQPTAEGLPVADQSSPVLP